MVNLVIQTAFLGDALLSIPLLKNIRQSRPEDDLFFVCRRGIGPIIEALQICDRVIEVDKTNSVSWKESIKELKSMQYNFVISPHKSFRTGWLVRQLSAQTKIGFSCWWNFWIFDERVGTPKELPEALRQLSLLTRVDLTFVGKLQNITQTMVEARVLHGLEKVDWRPVKIPDWASMSNHITSLPESSHLYQFEGALALAPGSVWNTKRWTKSGYISLGKALSARGEHVCVIGSPAEAELCNEVAGEIPGAVNLAGKISLVETLQVISLVDKIVCNDSGAMHMASIVETSCISLFGPTTLGFGYRPWQHNAIVLQKELKCRPCGLHGGKTCPLKTHECMEEIKSSTVLAAMDEL